MGNATTTHHCRLADAPRPRHWSDTKTFKAWPRTPDTTVAYGNFRLKWEVGQRPMTSRYGRDQFLTTVTKYFSKDGQAWQHDEYTVSYSWGTPNVDAGISQELEDAIVLGNKRKKQARGSELAKKRREKLKAEATEKGISLKEHTEQTRAKKQARNVHNVTKQDIERTTRLIEIGPTLRDLKNEIDNLLERIESRPKEINVTYVKRSKSRLKTVIDILQEWGR